MKSGLLSLSLFFLGLHCVLSESEKDDFKKQIRQLTPEDFEEAVNEAKYSLIFFYAPWCSHCKKAMPELAKAQTEIKDKEEGILIGAVDCTKHEDFCIDDHDMEGYPTFKLYRKGVFLKHYLGNPDDDFLTVLEQAKDLKPPPPPEGSEEVEEKAKEDKSEEDKTKEESKEKVDEEDSSAEKDSKKKKKKDSKKEKKEESGESEEKAEKKKKKAKSDDEKKSKEDKEESKKESEDKNKDSKKKKKKKKTTGKDEL